MGWFGKSSEPVVCGRSKAPAGWWCSRNANHDGPCAAHAEFSFPHCDSKILHSPGTCRFCDMHPDWQEQRAAQGIAFSDMATEDALQHGLVPCPSTYYRAPAVRDLWGGNVPG